MDGLFFPDFKRGAQAPETKDFPFEVRAESVSDDGTFEGYGSVFGGEPDSHRDVVAPGAFHNSIKAGGRNRNGIALLWQHWSEFPVGTWEEIREDEKGLYMKGKLIKEAAPMGVPVYQTLKAGAVKGLSIGFTIKKFDRDEETGIRTLKEIELWEVSLVTFPAAVRAQVTGVKDIMAARTPRELEQALRDAGLSRNESKYVVSMAKDKLGRREAGATDRELLATLRDVNLSLEVFKTINLS